MSPRPPADRAPRRGQRPAPAADAPPGDRPAARAARRSAGAFAGPFAGPLAWVVAARFRPVPTAVAVAVAGLVAAARPARADEVERLTAQLTSGDEAARAAAFKSLEGRPALIGSVLGPLLRLEGASDAAAHAAAWLAARPDGLLLADDVLRRARTEPMFPRAILAVAPARGEAWARLVAAARRVALDPAAADDLRRGGIAFLATDPSVDSVGALAELWAGGAGELAREAQAGVELAVAYRFPDPAAARAWAAEHAKTPFLDAVRTLSWLKDSPEYPVYARMVRESKERIRGATGLDGLEGYLDPLQTPWPEVRRIAAERGAQIKAEPRAWLDLLSRILRVEDDPETLRLLLLVAAGLEVTDAASMRSAPLADAILLRLSECCSLPRAQQGLLDLLARVGDTASVKKAQAWADRPGTDPQVLEAWLRAAAAVGGLDDQVCTIHQARAASDRPEQVEVRVRALEALGARRAEGADAWKLEAVARQYLWGILRSEDALTNGMRLETVPSARAAAIRALEAFPDLGTYARLRQLAESPPEPPELARLAGSVLGKQAVRDAAAGRELLDLAANGRDLGVRRAAIADLARVATEAAERPDATAPKPETDRATREELRKRVVAFLGALLADTAAEPTLRTAAAEAAAPLSEASLLPAFATLVVDLLDREEALRNAAQAPFERLVTTLVRGDPSHDDAVNAALVRVATAGGGSIAIPIADAAAEAGGARLKLQALRAGLRLQRARGATGPQASPEALAARIAAQRADLVDAHKILRSTLKAGGAAGDLDRAQLAPVKATHRDVVKLLLALPGLEEPLRRSALFSGLAAAAMLGDAASVEAGQPWLVEARAIATPPTDEEQATLDAFVAAAKRLAPPSPR
ncbi:MAG: hypothetical protein U1E39_11160 [Planctomycetota bacterium]